ncbi:MAG TPA: hypothetical protein VEC75_03530 [Stellaceae bacterium]|nr:hypothetical protein [Stellaceae bacterium]
MAAAKKRATLASDLLAAKPAGLVEESGPRRPRRAGPKRPVLLDVNAETQPEASAAPDREAEAAILRSALSKGGGLFSRKGDASAATFKPWYWRYDGENAVPPGSAAVALLPPPAAHSAEGATSFLALLEPQEPVFPFEVPPAPLEPPAGVVEILPPASPILVLDDPQALEAYRHHAEFAEQLSLIIEGILASRDFAALVGLRSSYTREEQRAMDGVAGLLPAPTVEITHASLRAELAEARAEPEVEEGVEAGQPHAKSRFDRVLLFGGAAMVLLTGGLIIAM